MAVPEETRRDVFSRIKKDISAQALSEWFLNWITSLTLCFHWRALRNRGNARTSLERTCWQAEGGEGDAQCFSLARCLPVWQEAASGSLSLWSSYGTRLFDENVRRYVVEILYLSYIRFKTILCIYEYIDTLHKRGHYGITNRLKWKSIILLCNI